MPATPITKPSNTQSQLEKHLHVRHQRTKNIPCKSTSLGGIPCKEYCSKAGLCLNCYEKQVAQWKRQAFLAIAIPIKEMDEQSFCDSCSHSKNNIFYISGVGYITGCSPCCYNQTQ